MTPAPATGSTQETTPPSDRGQTTGVESVADDTAIDPTDPMGMNPSPNQGGAAFPGNGSGSTSGYGEETLSDDSTETSDRDDEVVNGEALSTNEVISDDIDDDVA
jgi:hypothetical protein